MNLPKDCCIAKYPGTIPGNQTKLGSGAVVEPKLMVIMASTRTPLSVECILYIQTTVNVFIFVFYYTIFVGRHPSCFCGQMTMALSQRLTMKLASDVGCLKMITIGMQQWKKLPHHVLLRNFAVYLQF